jgi:hypothetical protein
MPDAQDLLSAWREATHQLRGLAGSVAGQAGSVPVALLAPLQRQADLIEQMLRRQLELEQELLKRAVAPAQATADALGHAPEAMRAQAAAFRAAAASFTQVADLLDVEAAAVDQTLSILKTPVQAAQWGLGRLPGGGAAGGEQETR